MHGATRVDGRDSVDSSCTTRMAMMGTIGHDWRKAVGGYLFFDCTLILVSAPVVGGGQLSLLMGPVGPRGAPVPAGCDLVFRL